MAIPLNDNILVEANKPADPKYGPWSSTDAALAGIIQIFRHKGLTVGILVESTVTPGLFEVVEYWFKDGTNLVPKEPELDLNITFAEVQGEPDQNAALVLLIQTKAAAAAAAVVNSSPAALDTLNELAAAMGNDPNFATTITGQIASKEAAFAKNTAFNKNFGQIAGTIAEGNDARFTDERTPAANTVTPAKVSKTTTATGQTTDTILLMRGGAFREILFSDFKKDIPYANPWATGVSYVAGVSFVFAFTNLYICNTSHVAGASFATDFNQSIIDGAQKWTLISQGAKKQNKVFSNNTAGRLIDFSLGNIVFGTASQNTTGVNYSNILIDHDYALGFKKIDASGIGFAAGVLYQSFGIVPTSSAFVDVPVFDYYTGRGVLTIDGEVLLSLNIFNEMKKV